MSAFDNATLMITGGTGSFGSTVLKPRRSSSTSVMSATRSPSRTLCPVLTTSSMLLL